MSTLKFNKWLDLDGKEIFKCRAFVNFNGTGTVAIRSAGNVSSITDNGVGDYTINFTTPFVDTNYALVGFARWNDGNEHGLVSTSQTSIKTVSSMQIKVANSTTPSTSDSPEVSAIVFG